MASISSSGVGFPSGKSWVFKSDMVQTPSFDIDIIPQNKCKFCRNWPEIGLLLASKKIELSLKLKYQIERVSAMFEFYNPQNTYMPQRQNFQMPQQPPQIMQPPMTLTRVTGMDGAKAFQMPPNSVAALFDGGEDIFYIKSTDGAGFPTIKAFAFTPIDAKPTQADFVTRQEFEELKGMIVNGKQYIQRQPDPEEWRSGTGGGHAYEYGAWAEPTGAIKEPLFKRPTDS